VRLPSELFKPARGAIATLACALTVGACGRSIGQPFEVAAADTLTPGKSTYEDAVARFGTASHFKGYGQGKVAHWHYLKDRPGGGEYSSVTIMFDRDGRMVGVVERLDSKSDGG
jgi:hypothetical protein